MVLSKVSWRRRPLLRAVPLFVVTLAALHLLSPLSAKTNRNGILYWHGDPAERRIALTFDDGPNEPYTSQILDILRTEGVPATFFVLGENVEAHPDIARRIVRDGHTIANHSYTHSDLVFDTKARVRSEILKTEQAIERVTGERTRLFRPPYGYKDFFTVHQSQKLGYVMVQWSVTGQDWRRPGANQIVSNVLKGARPGSIVLLHDGDKWHRGGDRSQTVAALPLMIRALREQGYSFAKLPDLLHLPPHSEPASRG
jgi:peptidoglycan/xylan/chitin deacetylase (PgdA/CDA1 family)